MRGVPKALAEGRGWDEAAKSTLSSFDATLSVAGIFFSPCSLM
jgi:hypothetical protein